MRTKNFAEKRARKKKAEQNALPCFPRLHSVLAVTLVELLDTAARLDVALTSREERMAFRANIDVELFLRGARLERVATAAGDRSLVVLRMDTLFHSLHLAFPQRLGIDTSKLCASLV